MIILHPSKIQRIQCYNNEIEVLPNFIRTTFQTGREPIPANTYFDADRRSARLVLPQLAMTVAQMFPFPGILTGPVSMTRQLSLVKKVHLILIPEEPNETMCFSSLHFARQEIAHTKELCYQRDLAYMGQIMTIRSGVSLGSVLNILGEYTNPISQGMFMSKLLDQGLAQKHDL